MQQQPWDASVKGLTAVPQVLAMMNDKLDWTQQVGEAFLRAGQRRIERHTAIARQGGGKRQSENIEATEGQLRRNFGPPASAAATGRRPGDAAATAASRVHHDRAVRSGPVLCADL